MQHRIANSLQIIASIIMLKARTVQSTETRIHNSHQNAHADATYSVSGVAHFLG